MTSTSLLVSSPELNLEKEICNTSYLLTLKLRQNFIFARSLERKFQEWIHVTQRETHYN